MVKVLLKPLARSDIKKIWQYTFENWGSNQADTYVSELGNSINSLANNPKLGRPIDNIRSEYRLYQHRHHLIIYQIELSIIEVVRILGKNMDVKNRL